jgi:CubicO group peptidase (beta-lactamase class C family)
MTATCVLLLVGRGQLDLDDPVCAYWPEFAAHDKEGVLIRHAVSHLAGVPGLETPVSVEEATDDLRMAELVAAQAAIASPGETLCYHALTFGWLCGELVRRVDGQSVGRFFAEEIASPLGLEAWIGLPEREEPRVAVVERAEGFGVGETADDAAPKLVRDDVGWSIWANPPRFADDVLAANLRRWRAAEVPASNGVATARSLARLYGCLARGGEIDGVRLLAPEAVELGRRRLSEGRDPYLDAPLAFGLGYMLQSDGYDPAASALGPPADAFGHPGAGGSVHGAWPTLRTGFSYATNLVQNLGSSDARGASLLGALHEVVAGR